MVVPMIGVFVFVRLEAIARDIMIIALAKTSHNLKIRVHTFVLTASVHKYQLFHVGANGQHGEFHTLPAGDLHYQNQHESATTDELATNYDRGVELETEYANPIDGDHAANDHMYATLDRNVEPGGHEFESIIYATEDANI